MKLMSRHRLSFRRVATWLRAGQEKRCRDTDLMLRHGSGCLVVTWCRDQGFGSRHGRSVGGAEAGRDMGLTSRPGLLNLGSRHHFEVATWLVQFGVATWTLFRSLHGHCSWTLFMDTVHRVKKK